MLQELNENQKEIIRRFKESSLSAKDFCLESNIALHSLYYLLKKEKLLIEQSNNKVQEIVKYEIPTVNNVNTPSIIKIEISNAIIEVNDNLNDELLLRVIKVLKNA